MPMSRPAWRSRTLLAPGCQATVSMAGLLCAVQLTRTRWPSSTTQTEEDSEHVSDGSDVNLITGRSVIKKQLRQSNYSHQQRTVTKKQSPTTCSHQQYAVSNNIQSPTIYNHKQHVVIITNQQHAVTINNNQQPAFTNNNH